MPELILVRHAQTSGQAPDAPLTAEGSDQAEALIERLAPHGIDRIVSSPYVRARDTIAPFARRTGIELELDERLIEHRLADPPVPAWQDYIRAAFTDPDRRAPGGDPARATLARARSVVAAMVGSPAERPVLVTHGLLLALLLDSFEPGFGYAGWESLRNPDVFLASGPSLDAMRFERLPDRNGDGRSA